jgi:signal transduction histidine kinase
MNAMSAGAGRDERARWRDRWRDRVRWSVLGRPRVVVAVLAPAATAEAMAGATDAAVSPAYGLLLCLLALGTTVPPAFAGTRSAAVAVTAAVVLSIMPFDALTVSGAAGELYVLHRLGRRGPPLLVGVLPVPFAVLALAEAVREAPTAVLTVLLAAAAPATAWASLARTARQEAQLQVRARQLLTEDLADHVARGERARIARDLHDVVAHHISMVIAQTEAARLTTPGMPEAGARRLEQIRDTARAGILEMRRLLGVLREDVPTPEHDRRPQPGLQQLNELLDQARATSGAATRLIVSGTPVALDPGVELVAYRIVQEALSNSRRHAPGVAVDVELRYTDDALRVRVRDNGPGPPEGAPEGHGLQGMRERAAAVGGRLRAGRPTVGGFMLEATLPAKAEVA